jgi:DNA-binding NarL/FixJ family response regulator
MSLQSALRDVLSSVSLDPRHGPWADVMSILSDAFPDSLGLFYSLAATERAPSVDRLFSSHPLPGARQLIDHYLKTEGRYGLYRPLRPEPEQRNRAMLLSEVATPAEKEHWRWSWRSWGLGGADQLRTLVCDGALMLGWFGVFRPDGEFTFDDRELLQSTGQVLREHLRWEAQLQRSELLEAGLEACLESLGRAAALVDARGAVQADNLLLRKQGDEARRALAEDLSAALRGQPTRFDFKRLRSAGETHWVAIERIAPPLNRLRWNITAREREVLDGVLKGQTNRAIAVRLEISERTVETHVTRLLHRTGCATRAALVVSCLRR